MINNKTVFILGAGASKPYGFPTSVELSNEVISNSFQLVKSIYRKNGITDKFFREKEREYKIFFLSKFEEANKSRSISIDDFISKENNSIGRNKALKLMIHCLMRFEEGSIERNYSDWIELFIDRISQGVKSLVENGKIDDNLSNVKIITFNYERSFEYFLLKRLSETYPQKAKLFLRLFTNNIVHVYGSIGKILDSYLERDINGGFCDYGYFADDVGLDIIIQNIKLIYDERMDSDAKIKEFLKDVDQIFFLGFGYDGFNVNNLSLRLIENQEVVIYGTVKGKVEHIDNIKQLIHNQNDKITIDRILLYDFDCKTLIDKHWQQNSNQQVKLF